VITGFPSESDELFNETFNFLQELDFTYLHVFSYSKRKGTKAANLSGQINGEVIKYRTNILTKLSETKLKEYSEKLLSNKTILSGVAEKKSKDYYTALSDRFVRVYFKENTDVLGKYNKFIPIGNYKDGLEVKVL